MLKIFRRRDTAPSQFVPPELWNSARSRAQSADRQFAVLSGFQLLIILAAASSVLIAAGNPKLVATISGIAFIVSLLTAATIRGSRSEETARATSELADFVLSLCWRFAVAAPPFGPAIKKPDVAIGQLNSALAAAVQRCHVPLPPDHGARVTQQMVTLRADPLSSRREFYLRERIEQQLTVSESKLVKCKRWSAVWLIAASVLQLAGIGAALLQLGYHLPTPVLSLIAALIASIAAWTQVRRYASRTQRLEATIELLKEKEGYLPLLNRESLLGSAVSQIEFNLAPQYA